MASALNRYNLGLFKSGTYIPAINDLGSITQANPALVTTVADHNYVVNQQVQFFIPPQWGMTQLDTQKGYVLSIPASDQFTVNINTSNYNAFVTPTSPAYVVIDPAQVSGIGGQNTGTLAPGGVLPLPQTVPGAYENQAP